VHGICGVDRDDMFVDVIFMHMVEVAVVKIVHMAVVANRGMPAVWAMLMGVAGMVFLATSGHDFPSFLYNPAGTIGHAFSAACSIALRTNRRTWVSESA
jgi:hypothetical protein